MASDHGFLARWSARKAAVRDGLKHDGTEATEPAPDAATPADEPPLDLASLPRLEDLTADSDYTLFLRKGVPTALANAALRRAWETDPFISSFREMADYDWDFNAPGYGDLRPDDDVAAMLERLYRPPAPTTAEAEPAPEAEPDAPADAACDAVPQTFALANEPTVTSELEIAETQVEPPVGEAPPPSRRRHGGAIPV